MGQGRTFGGAAESAVPAVCVLSSEGIVVGWSRSAEELLGYPAAEILGRPGTVLRTEGPAAGRVWGWSGGYGDREHRTGLADLRHRDGTQILAHLERSLIRTRDGDQAWIVTAVPTGSGATGSSLLEPVLHSAPVVMAVWDDNLRCVWLNDEAQRMRETFPYFELGRRLPQTPEWQAPVPAERIRTVLADGEPVIDREARWVSADQNTERTFSTFLFRIEGVDDRVLGVCLMAINIAHSRAHERLALLREASLRIGTTLDVGKTAQELVDLAVPDFADYATVDLTELVMPGPEPLGRLGASGGNIPVLRRAALATIHTGVPQGLQPLGQPVYVPPRSPYTKTLESGGSHLESVLDTSPGSWISWDADRATVIRGFGFHSGMLIPLKARGNLLGLVLFIRSRNPTPYTTDDVTLAEELADRAALSLDNARQYTRERNAALALQRQLLPSKLSGGAALEVAARYLPSNVHEGVGGDWFDAFPLRNDRIALVVGDVTGRGIHAAASMGRLRTAVRTLAYLDLAPEQLLTRLDELYAQQLQEDPDTDESPRDVLMATCLYAVYDPVTRRCTMAAAGHPPPALVDPISGVSFPSGTAGTPIGLGLGTYEPIELDLAGGSLLCLYTDGLIETRQQDIEAGIRRLGAALTGATGPLDDLASNVISSMVGQTAEDDIALLLARTPMQNS
jgi:PAS domain S-box-containing protein